MTVRLCDWLIAVSLLAASDSVERRRKSTPWSDRRAARHVDATATRPQTPQVCLLETAPQIAALRPETTPPNRPPPADKDGRTTCNAATALVTRRAALRGDLQPVNAGRTVATATTARAGGSAGPDRRASRQAEGEEGRSRHFSPAPPPTPPPLPPTTPRLRPSDPPHRQGERRRSRTRYL